MRCTCEPDWRDDPFSRALVAGILESMFTTKYLIFRKTEWIEDCGFYFGEKDVELPRGFEGKSAKIRCFSVCLDLLNKGWTNGIAEKNRDIMTSYLGSLEQKEQP